MLKPNRLFEPPILSHDGWRGQSVGRSIKGAEGVLMFKENIRGNTATVKKSSPLDIKEYLK